MENKSIVKAIIVSVFLFMGLALLGFFIFKGIKTLSDKDRVVNVKGLAEMDMKATSATISLNFSFSGDDLNGIITQTDTKTKAIVAYLKTLGYAEGSIAVSDKNVIDRQTYYDWIWEGGRRVQTKIDRYTISQGIVIQSNDVEGTESKASQIKLSLVTNNLTADVSTAYTFPELNSIKPQMIAQSTQNARIAGEQFANDSHATLGKIKTASQGQITIAGRYYDEESSGVPQEPYIQRARVVSTIVFFLE
ncbi:MAG: SIMPL domain-containing protein [Bacteroidales bacterium]|jgi:hypothetical protein|nr:SIMPL domain-containing protein [Bacteroidales bacterium]